MNKYLCRYCGKELKVKPVTHSTFCYPKDCIIEVEKGQMRFCDCGKNETPKRREDGNTY